VNFLWLAWVTRTLCAWNSTRESASVGARPNNINAFLLRSMCTQKLNLLPRVKLQYYQHLSSDERMTREIHISELFSVQLHYVHIEQCLQLV